VKNPEAFSAIVTQDAGMQAVFRCVEAIAVTSRPVLITGETGVGKEIVARVLHSLSERPGKFVAVNVAGVDESLFSDTLFGHKKGAFTGADTDRQGLIAEAAAGTLFLDEIGDLNAVAQIKLLRLMQEYEYMPLGSNVSEAADVRVVVATHQDLAALQETGKFRKDLYYRLKCHHIHIPPLRERKQDIPLLVDYFVTRAAEAMKKRRPAVPKGLTDLLGAYSFPGNVRELESMMFDAVSKTDTGIISKANLSQHLESSTGTFAAAAKAAGDQGSPLDGWEQLPTLDEIDRLLVLESMRRANGNQTVAARILGISQPALSKRLKNLSL
jgi:DNA-binding NtrC family response regulator